MMSQTFSKPRAMLNKAKRKQVSRDVIHVSVLQTDHRQRPITARVAFTSLYNVALLWHD